MHDKILPLHVAQVSHRIEERLPLGGPGRVRPDRQEPNRIHLPLGRDGTRQDKENRSRARQERAAVYHLILLPALDGAAG